MTDAIRGELVAPEQPLFDEVRMAANGYLAGYNGHTLLGYRTDLNLWGAWCQDHQLEIFDVQRPHIELYARSMEAAGKARGTIARRIGTIAGFYRYCEEEGFIDKSPARHVRRPKLSMESTTLGLDRNELGMFITQAGVEGGMSLALACLLGLNGLRVSEACGCDIDDLGIDRGHRTMRIIGKGHKPAVFPLAPKTARAIDLAIGERMEGPILLRRDGQRMDRHAATRIVKRLARKSGVTKHISPHSLRHSFITAALDAGVPLRDVQIAARHADPRTTTRYDRGRENLDRHCTYVVAAFVAGS